MKKLVSILLILSLMLVPFCIPATALAEDMFGQGDTVARNAELAAFMDGNGRIYVSGLERPVNTTPAAGLVSIDPYRILFFAQPDESTGIPQGRLISLNLNGFNETLITDDAFAACLDEENVYYISKSKRSDLIRYNLDSRRASVAFTATESLDHIYTSSIGVVVSLVDGAGTYITDPLTGQFVSYAEEAAVELIAGDGFEAYLTETNNLFVRQSGALTPAMVDKNVSAWAIADRCIYYLSGSEDALILKQYMVDSNTWNPILTLPQNMEPQLTASEHSLYVLSKDNNIYSVDVSKGQLVIFATLDPPQAYKLEGTRTLSGYRIEAVSGQLNIYGVVEDTNAVPTFTFVDFDFPQDTEPDSTGSLLLSAYAIEDESTVWDLLQPAASYSPLRSGSRGEAVSAIQQPLFDKGYYNYYIDGIFGWRTERAVELLQDALDITVTGIADEELQRVILSGNFPAYDPYHTLSRGDTGMRVTEMQQRLRDLGYLADDADGIFGVRTQAAVTLFQSENGLGANGIADSQTLSKLYSGSARPCSSYIDLRRGDSGYRVRELNQRLKDLYYLEGSVGSNYNSATEAAVRRFQMEVGLRVTGEATSAVQRRLFSRDCPEYSDYITLMRGDDNSRVLQMQRRLAQLGYYTKGLDGYFGSGTYQAVRQFQRQAGLPVTGVADPNTLRHLFAADAPRYQPPINMTKPVVDLFGIFELNNNGVYLVPRDTQELHFYWSAEGVRNYSIKLEGEGKTLISASPINYESVEFGTGNLHEDVIYSFTVTAHPKDTVNNKDASTTVRFRIVPEPVTLESVEISINGTFTYKDDEELYEISRDMLRFSWLANGGEVGRYVWSITSEGTNKALYSGDGADVTSLDVTDASAYALEAGTVYTLSVTAWPLNSSEGEVSDSLNFRIPVPNEPEPVIPSYVLTPGTFKVDANGSADGQDQTVGILTISGCGGSYHYEMTNADSTQTYYSSSEARCEAEQSVNLNWNGEGFAAAPEEESLTLRVWITFDDSDFNAAESANQPYELTVNVEHAPAEEAPPVEEIPETVSFHNDQPYNWNESGESSWNLATVTLPKDGTVQWNLTDVSGSVEGQAQLNVSLHSLPIKAAEPADVVWNCLNDDGSRCNGTRQFQLSVWINYDDGSQGNFRTEIFTIIYPDQPQASPQGDAANGGESEDTAVPLGEPVIDIEPSESVETVEFEDTTVEDVHILGDGIITVSWTAEGEVSHSQLSIVGANGMPVEDSTYSENSASFSESQIQDDVVYEVKVTVYAGGSDGVSSKIYCMRPGEGEQVEQGGVQPGDTATEAPEGELPDDAITEAPEGEQPDDAATETPEGEQPETEAPDGIIPDDETNANETPGAEAPTVNSTDTEIQDAGVAESLPVPSITITPNEGVSDSGVIQVAMGTVELRWDTEGDVSAYHVRITDSNGNAIVDQPMNDAVAASISTENMASGMIYTLEVTATFSSGESTSASVNFSLATDEVERTEPTPEPESAVAPTEAAIEAPAVTVEPESEAPTGYATIFKGDRGDMVMALQERLAELGYLSGNCDGIYGNDTANALSSFQQRAGLPVNPDSADDATQQRLFADDAPYADISDTAEASETVAAEEPTPEPEIEQPSIEEPSVGVNNAAPDAAPVALGEPVLAITPNDGTDENGNLLVSEGILTLSWGADGDISSYHVRITDNAGNTMVEQELQATTAQVRTANLAPGMIYTLNVTATFSNGETTASSLNFTYSAQEQNESVPSVDETYTEEPGGESSYEEPPVVDSYDEESSDGYDEPYDGESTQEVPVTGNPEISITPFTSSDSNGTILVPEGTLSLNWPAQGDVSSYSVTITDAYGATLVEQIMNDSGAQINTSGMTPNVIYTLSVTANFSSGASTSASLNFMYPVEETPVAEEPYYEEPSYEGPSVEVPHYEESSTVEPSNEEPYGGESVQEAPVTGNPEVSVTPFTTSDSDGTILVPEGTLNLSWPAQGDVSNYNVTITDAYGSTLIDENVTDSGAQINTNGMTPNVVYTLSVTAYFSNGASTSASLNFMYPVEETPVTEEPYYEETYAEEPSYEEPYYEEPYAEEPSYEEPYYEEPYAEEPSYEEPYYEEPYVEEPSYEESGAADLYPMDNPDAWNKRVDTNSDPAAITVVQTRLCEWGWLDAGTYSDGVLDEATMQAVIDFQNYMNSEQGKDLAVADLNNPAINRKTLKLLFNADGKAYTK